MQYRTWERTTGENSKKMKIVPQQYTIPPQVVMVEKNSGATAHCYTTPINPDT